MPTGLVYYALDATRRTQYLKIGYSTNLRGRILGLREISASGQSPIVLAVEEGDLALERERHEQFAAVRSHGEWFHYIDALREFVTNLDHPHAYLLDRPHLWPYAGGWGPLSTSAGGQKSAKAIEEEYDITPVQF